MEIDHISYIFGSFTRRRQSQEVTSANKRKSIEQMKINHDRSKSTPHTSKKADVLPRAKSVCNNVKMDDNCYKCAICGKYFIEPRVLPCLHTFCTRCLHDIEAHHYSSSSSLNNKEEDGIDSGSGGSGCVSDKRIISHETWKGVINCPTCGECSECPPGGILDFPPNYMLQHRMVLATLNSRSTRLLCDFCTIDIDATHRCTECAANLCVECYDIHKRQKLTSVHEILTLEEARRKGITKVRRQIMCTTHPERELTVFCSSCCQVICRDCLSSMHRNHVCEPVSRAVKTQIVNIRLALERTKSITEKSSLTACKFQTSSKQIESQCNQMQIDVEKFIKSYKQAIEEHRKELLKQIRQIREQKLQSLEDQKNELQKKSKETKEVLNFVSDLLDEGTDVEILNFVKPVLRKLDICNKIDKIFDTRVFDSLQFLHEEVAENYDNCCPIYGVLTTQTVSPKNCVISVKDIQNIRVGKCVEVHLESMDRNNSRLQRGGEIVTAELRNKDANTIRNLNVNIEDLHDGTYKLSFVPDTARKLLLSVYIKGQAVKESPFPLIVRSLRQHHGVFHCCNFCSSGGSKEAACGCGGTMPGGYKGCGHGHDGHPGKRHWSCCGNILEHSECIRANSSHYQYTL